MRSRVTSRPFLPTRPSSTQLLHPARSHLLLRLYASSSSAPLIVGIRREDPSRLWERRIPLTPTAVKSLIKEEGVQVLLQPCARRIFPTEEYLKVGAKVHETLEPAHIILGIKETPLTELLVNPTPDGRSRTQIMFSHTAKGQSYNMPLLSKFTQPQASQSQASSNPNPNPSARLIDYELLTDVNGKRTVAFGWYAGAAGVPEALSALAHDHLEIGVSSPFLLLPRPYNHRGLDDLRQSLRNIGSIISESGTPKETGPYIVALTGNGNVSNGALDLLKELPLKHVQVEDLEHLATSPDTDRRFIYLVHVNPSDYLIDIRGRPYDRGTYYSEPQMYSSLFYQRVAPYISLLINGVGWKPGFPRLMNNIELAEAQKAAQRVGRARFRSVADISCDIEGGLEFVSKAATIDDPFFKSKPTTHSDALPGIQVMSVDILPSEIPLDSSRHFSDKLMPYLRSLIRLEQSKDLGKDDAIHLDVLERGTIVKGGKLMPKHAWLNSQLVELAATGARATSTTSVNATADASSVTFSGRKKRVLLLGSGMVAKPAVDHIASRKDIELIVASNNIHEGQSLVASHENASAILLDIQDGPSLSNLVKQADVVISLLPMPLHAGVAKHCIAHQKHMVTASYISPAMRELNEEAIKADILLLNEIGLDPGIDHCSAVDLCEKIRAEGREIVSFVSVCGGLPAPEDSNVPLGYKFSWSPKGVLSAALNGAKFRLSGKDFEIPAGKLLQSPFSDIPLVQGLALECLPNRDSLSYGDIYGLEPINSLESMFRGTLRYKGFSTLMHSFASAGLLSQSNLIDLNARGGWQSLLAQSLSAIHGKPVKNNRRSLISALSDILPQTEVDGLLEATEQLSMVPVDARLYEGHPIYSSWNLPATPSQPTPVIDLFARLLAHKLRYLPGESDSVILSHEIISRPSSSTSDSTSSSSSESSDDEASSALALNNPTRNPTEHQELIHTSTLLLRQPNPSTSAMAQTVSLPLALAALRILDGHVRTRGVVGPTADKEIYRPVLKDMAELGLVMREDVRVRRDGNAIGERMLQSIHVS